MKQEGQNMKLYSSGFFIIPGLHISIDFSGLETAIMEAAATMKKFAEYGQKLINSQSSKCRYTKKHPIKGKQIINLLK